MRILAGDKVVTTWLELVEVDSMIAWNYTEEYDIDRDAGRPVLGTGHRDVLRSRAAVQALEAAIRAEIGR